MNDDDEFVFIYAGTKESAFVNAISSASIAHAVTRGCSSGLLSGCSCDSSRRQGPSQKDSFQWEGCSDDLEHGVAFARSFTDVKERNGNRKDSRDRAPLTLHNNNAGRKVSSLLYAIHRSRIFSALHLLLVLWF